MSQLAATKCPGLPKSLSSLPKTLVKSRSWVRLGRAGRQRNFGRPAGDWQRHSAQGVLLVYLAISRHAPGARVGGCGPIGPALLQAGKTARSVGACREGGLLPVPSCDDE